MPRQSQVIPRYDRPLFQLLPMDRPQHWASVSNRLEIGHNGRDIATYIEVPTALFPILADLNVPIGSEVIMFLEDDGNRMLFGVVVDGDSEDAELHDLWHYTFDQVPKGFFSL